MLVRQSPRSRVQASFAASRDGLAMTNGPLVIRVAGPDSKRNQTLTICVFSVSLTPGSVRRDAAPGPVATSGNEK